jgi:hypothetical protein
MEWTAPTTVVGAVAVGAPMPCSAGTGYNIACDYASNNAPPKQEPTQHRPIMISERYEQELDDAIFRYGDVRGRITTSMSMLTDSLLDLNALELYYQKPVSKAVAPSEIERIRGTLESIKELLRQTITPGEAAGV